MNKIVLLSDEQINLALKILDKHDGYYIKEIDDVLQSCKDALQKDLTQEIKNNLSDQTITLDQLISTCSKTEIISVKTKWIVPYLVELNKIIEEK